MPDESCRKCGGKLDEYAKCSHCSQAVMRVCLDCGKFAEKRFHSACFYSIDKLQAGTFFMDVMAS